MSTLKVNEKQLHAKLALIPPWYCSDDFRGVDLSEIEKEKKPTESGLAPQVILQ